MGCRGSPGYSTIFDALESVPTRAVSSTEARFILSSYPGTLNDSLKSILNAAWYDVVYHDDTTPTPSIEIQIQDILNRVEKQKGFVYSKASLNKKGELEIEVRPRHLASCFLDGIPIQLKKRCCLLQAAA